MHPLKAGGLPKGQLEGRATSEELGRSKKSFHSGFNAGVDSTFVIPTWAAQLLPELKKAFGDGAGERLNRVESSQSV